jgi:hypothetical protein
MKKLLLFSMVAAAVLFSACNDDSDNDVYSCEINMNYQNLMSIHGCVEASVQEDMDYVCSSANEMSPGSGKTGTGCPGGAAKTCSGVKGGTEYTAYFYDTEMKERSCDQIMSVVDNFDAAIR